MTPPTFPYSTQWAAVRTMAGWQLRRVALQPCQPSLLRNMETCHGNSFSRATSPPTTCPATEVRVPPFLPQLVALPNLKI